MLCACNAHAAHTLQVYDWRKLLPRGHGVGVALGAGPAPGDLRGEADCGGGGEGGVGLPEAAVSSIVRVFGEISDPEMTAALQAKVAEVTRGA